MSVEKKEASAESRLKWLDEELRQVKAALHKVEHELEQALNQVWILDSGLRKLEERPREAESLPGVREDIRELRSQVDRLQDRQNAVAGSAEEIGRQREADLEHERRERVAFLKEAEAAVRSVGQFESRIQHLEGSLRRIEGAVAELRQSQHKARRDIEDLTSRGARNLETALRLEHQLDAVANDVEALHKRDGELEEKLSLYEEKVRRQRERVDKFQEHLNLALEMKAQLDRARFERQQISERLEKLDALASELSGRTAEFEQGLARLDQRTQGQAGRLLEMAEQLRAQREAMLDQLKRVIRAIERQRRRQAESLTEEIKELSRSEFNPEQ